MSDFSVAAGKGLSASLHYGNTVDFSPLQLPSSSFGEADPTIEYWLVVKPANRLLYDALRRVLSGKPNFYVIRDRRSGDGAPPASGERRRSHVWHGDDMLVAERQIVAGRLEVPSERTFKT